jgi:hypothetical protein
MLLEDYMRMILAGANPEVETPQTYSLLDLEGIGAALRKGKDAQDYVNELRNEWDNRA